MIRNIEIQRGLLFWLGIVGIICSSCAAIPRTTYLNEFDPPSIFLSMRMGRLAASEVNLSLVEKGVREVRKIGYEAKFEGAVRNVGCNSICYFYRPLYTDDLYIVLTVTESQSRLVKWFSFSPLESGSP